MVGLGMVIMDGSMCQGWLNLCGGDILNRSHVVVITPLRSQVCIFSVSPFPTKYACINLLESGLLFTWGGGMYGKLGHGDERGHSTPCLVEALSDVRVEQIACGSRHTVVLVGVYFWYCLEFWS